MNNISSFELGEMVEGQSPQPTPTININQQENLGTLGVFISSVLLSLGGCIAMLFSAMSKSRCKNIDCLCFKCDRENLGENSAV